jgi:hypothetical protein
MRADATHRYANALSQGATPVPWFSYFINFKNTIKLKT